MATFWKRLSKSGVRWTVLVRKRGRKLTRTFPTKAAGEVWARSQELAIDVGKFVAPKPGLTIFADLVDTFLDHRKRIARPPGKTFNNALTRLKTEHGLAAVSELTVDYWRAYALKRIEHGISGSTVAADLAYATAVLKHALREGHTVDAAAPGVVRTMLREDGVRVVSRERSRRITDAELKRLFKWIDANASRTHLPLRDLVEFALATGMRRQEILDLKWTDIDGRVARIKRKHPVDRERIESVPLLKANAKTWPRVDPLAIIERQPKGGSRVFPHIGDTLGFWFERACEGAAIDGVVFHSLRHECLSRLAERGFDPLRLALVGGHRDLRNVKRYARLDAALLANE